MLAMNYIPRLIDSELKQDLEIFGSIIIEGPKWVGKTTSAKAVSKSVINIQDPDHREEYLEMAKFKPSLLLEGSTPRLIDEWQDVPELWDAVRMAVDNRDEPGQFILTGSVIVDKTKICHTGTGRIYCLKMGTLSLLESGDSVGSISLRGLFNGSQQIEGVSEKTTEDIAKFIVRGGWPKSIGVSDAAALKLVKGYCDRIIDTEISEGSGTRHDNNRVRAVMKSLSRSISAPLSKTNIIKDVSSDISLTENTLDTYLNALRDIYVLQELEAWSPNLRSKTAVRTADTVHFCDPAIAAYFLSASPGDLLRDLHTFGLLFESLVIRDLRTYVQFLDGEVFHYRDKTGLEADAIIHLHDGRWAAIEVKLGGSWVDEAAVNLLKLKDRVDSEKMGEPAFLAVVTGTQYAYTREDGVHVIPITLLGP